MHRGARGAGAALWRADAELQAGSPRPASVCCFFLCQVRKYEDDKFATRSTLDRRTVELEDQLRKVKDDKAAVEGRLAEAELDVKRHREHLRRRRRGGEGRGRRGGIVGGHVAWIGHNLRAGKPAVPSEEST